MSLTILFQPSRYQAATMPRLANRRWSIPQVKADFGPNLVRIVQGICDRAGPEHENDVQIETQLSNGAGLSAMPDKHDNHDDSVTDEGDGNPGLSASNTSTSGTPRAPEESVGEEGFPPLPYSPIHRNNLSHSGEATDVDPPMTDLDLPGYVSIYYELL